MQSRAVLVLAALLLLLQAHVEARVFSRCDLVHELRRLGAPGDQVATWVCIAERESSYNTQAVNPINSDGSKDHGIFQINDRYWCEHGSAGKGCGLTCGSLLDDSIDNDFKCALQVHTEHSRLQGNGFLAWTVYSPFCSGDVQRYEEGC